MKTAYYSLEEFSKVYKELGISEEIFNSCNTEISAYRTGVEVSDDCIFTHLKLINESMNETANSNLVLILKRDELYFVAINDPGDVSRQDYNKVLEKCGANNSNVESFLAKYFELITKDDYSLIEDAYNKITTLEDLITNDKYEDDFYNKLQDIKRYLLVVRNYYDQLVDTLEVLEENFNEILEPKRICLISNALRKMNRLKNDNDMLIDLMAQLQATYAAHLDTKMNSTMKLLTIITTIFMPLTLIVGWYGMNFTTMPELHWVHGYMYVILLSIILSSAVIIIAKIKKWF